jgi:hypothetical protein
MSILFLVAELVVNHMVGRPTDQSADGPDASTKLKVSGTSNTLHQVSAQYKYNNIKGMSYQHLRANPNKYMVYWDPMPELTITSPYMSTPKVDSKTFTIGNPTPESTLTLCQGRLYPPVRDFRFGL